jgi:hypothetical protein
MLRKSEVPVRRKPSGDFTSIPLKAQQGKSRPVALSPDCVGLSGKVIV